MIARFYITSLVFGATLSAAGLDFSQQIKPILESACVRCHGADKAKGGLRLDTSEAFAKGGDNGPLISKTNPDDSELIRRITLPRGHEDLMPQEADPLSGPFRKWMIEWVKNGAPFPEGITLEPRKKAVPGLAEIDLIPKEDPASIWETAEWIDRLIEQENAVHIHTASEPVGVIDDLAFLRRSTLDLIGRIPTAAEITEFESWSSAERREKWIDKLLTDTRFSGRWSVFFADMLRIRSQVEGGPQLLAYMNQSLEENKPYDQLARELISTNGRARQTPAAGFVLGDDANPMALAGATAQVFLGVRIACAECHDHPFDDWKQKEFYQLAAFFGQTKKMEVGKARRIYSTEGDEMAVQWPPELEKPPAREPVTPKFPFELVSYTTKPSFISRFESLRQTKTEEAIKESSVDDLLDGIDAKPLSGDNKNGPDVLGEATDALHGIDINKDLYRPSQLREELARQITDPRNPYFARSFVNRIWAELVGRGFVEPLDNFSAYNEIRHPQTLQFIAQEFTAQGFDFRKLVKTIMLTDAYQRGHLPPGVALDEQDHAEKAFAAVRPRRMLGEAMFDSIITAGHLLDFKWPAGANEREVTRQIRVPLQDETMAATPAAPAATGPAMMENAPAMQPKMASTPYDLEKNISLDFDQLLEKESTKELAMMKEAADADIEAERMAMMRAQAVATERYRLETIVEKVDDNPKFDSTLRMASPAPPSHFLRVFGQPSREGLGEFREEAPSLRQELMLINGKATHEASRVGPFEPVAKLLTGPTANPQKAVEFVYLEILTRRPSPEELTEGLELLSTATSPVDGMADLRWVLLNSHEFRYLP